MKKFFIPVLTMFCMLSVGMVNVLFAQSVSKEEAYTVCSRFVSEKFPASSEKSQAIEFQELILDENQPALYRFSVGDAGFVIVSASKKTPAVLAYSTDQAFEMIPPVRDLFHLYKQEIRTAEKEEWMPSKKANTQWKKYLSEDFAPQVPKGNDQTYLLTTTWNQNKFYNTYCPWDAGAGSYYDYHVPNGCVALACAQIMNYHHYPDHGVGVTSYMPQGYPRQTVYFYQQTYHWEAMCNAPMNYANEIAKIAHHMGVSIQMNYTPDGSGANTDRAKDKLRDVFKYDPMISIYYRGNYLDTVVKEYIAALKAEIDDKRPVYYSGCTQTFASCHAYVLDGYDADELFHLNFGWGGSSNGFYALDNFVTGGSHWDYQSEAIMHIQPSPVNQPTYSTDVKRLTASFGYIFDESRTAKPYPANPNTSWMVAVPEATSYTFSFDRLDLRPDVDFVTIYNGPTVESGVKATFTGTTVPSDICTVVADSVLVTFTSNGSGPAENTDYYGFQMSYRSQVPSAFCGEFSNVSDWNAVITDGSTEGVNYRPQANCSWNVHLNYISGYAFAFPKFDLGNGDFVEIYNATTNPPTLYKRFDINEQPQGVYQVNFSNMKVRFISDNWDQNDGFKMEYYAIASVDEFSGIDDLNVYPNPVSDNLHISFSLMEESAVVCRLFDAAGKVVAVNSFDALMGENTQSMDVSSLSQGFYMLEINTTKGKTIRKIMIQ